MKQWLASNIVSVIISVIMSLFGGGAIWGYLSERGKRKGEKKKNSADALQGMQHAYDLFIEDYNQKLIELRGEIEQLKTKLEEVSIELRQERKKYQKLSQDNSTAITELKKQLVDCLENSDNSNS